jgi:2',3'-cyclic-nucleotide 2'-phosphodiesterase/3'-nucleotidase
MHRLVALVLLAACASAPRTNSPQNLELLVAGTTDVHGWLRGWDYYASAADTTRGLTRAATIVDSLRAAHPGRVILVDAGDLLQGNPLAYTAARVSSDTLSPIVTAMNAMRYDAAAIGNHEFNYGVPFLDRAVAQARFPFLSANTYRVDGARKYRAWTMVERAGARVAIIGGTTPGVNVWDRDNVRGRVTVRAILPDVRTSVREARAGGADVVVVVLHSGRRAKTSLPKSRAKSRESISSCSDTRIARSPTRRLGRPCSCSRGTGREAWPSLISRCDVKAVGGSLKRNAVKSSAQLADANRTLCWL